MKIQQAIERLRERTHVPLFFGDIWDQDLDTRLKHASAEELFEGQVIASPQMAACALAGLHLWNDNFHAGHNLCQGIDTQTGSYWHGIGHRREGHQGEGMAANLGNARYWFRRVGDHPAFDAVYRSALTVLDSTGSGFPWAADAAEQLRARRRWDPFVVIDWFCHADAHALPAQAEEVLSEIQWREMDLLVDWCLQQAVRG
ncbi:MAG: uncharacterized protein K0Q72_68 [Armatimonadetes bacterium]|jgi:hypothetical protein|nr:uncharacterized protein [Armatimonadota bacterium]